MKLVEKKRLKEFGFNMSEYKNAVYYIDRNIEGCNDLVIKDAITNKIIDILPDEFDDFDVEELLREEE